VNACFVRQRYALHPCPLIDRPSRGNGSPRSWVDELENGELLTVAEAAGFEVLVTTDKNLSYQQSLAGRKIAVVVLGQGRWNAIKRCVPEIVAAVNTAAPGSFIEVEIPHD